MSWIGDAASSIWVWPHPKEWWNGYIACFMAIITGAIIKGFFKWLLSEPKP